jgi:hypothetical protein
LNARANRVSYGYSGLVAWYAAGPLGLEQGLDLARAPRSHGSGPLSLVFAVTGVLSPRVAPGAAGIVFTDRSGATVLSYRGLVASDARHRTLRSWVTIEHRRLVIQVADRGARYPLHVDPMIQLATLTASDSGQGFGAVAISGPTVVASAAFATVGGHASQGVVFVFSAPPGGWSGAIRETAQLIASDGQSNQFLGSSVGTDGPNVVAGGTAGLYLWTQPPTGWSGTMTQSAKLTVASGAALGSAVAISAQTIVAAGATTLSRVASPIYVFTEPASGWTGAVHESATLTAPGALGGPGGFGLSVGISGQTIVAGGGGAAYVFTEPVGGWSSESATATLTPSDRPSLGNFSSVTISGPTVAATAGAPGAVYIFTQPPGGWAGTVHESAKLVSSDGSAGQGPGAAATFSGQTIVATGGLDGGADAAYVFTEPAIGWSGTLHENAKLTAVSDVPGAPAARCRSSRSRSRARRSWLAPAARHTCSPRRPEVGRAGHSRRP